MVRKHWEKGKSTPEITLWFIQKWKLNLQVSYLKPWLMFNAQCSNIVGIEGILLKCIYFKCRVAWRERGLFHRLVHSPSDRSTRSLGSGPLESPTYGLQRPKELNQSLLLSKVNDQGTVSEVNNYWHSKCTPIWDANIASAGLNWLPQHKSQEKYF